jgi:hypothetical protein
MPRDPLRCIAARIDAALEKMRAQGMEVRAICLTAKDHDALDAELCRRWKEETGRKRFKATFLSYRDHMISRSVRCSSVYSTRGVETKVPHKLSHRVAEPVA